MPVTAVTKQTKVSQNRICHLIRSRVKEAWEKTDWSTLERLGVVETSSRKGHSYGTAFLEIDGRETQRGNGASKVAQLLFFTLGKDKATFDAFVAELNNRGFDPS
jgi:transposase